MSTERWRVLVTCGHLQRTIERYRPFLERHSLEVELPAMRQQLSEEQLLEIIEHYDAVVAGDDPFTARVLERGCRLRVVAKWGVGVDAIDRVAAERLGIQVTNTPGAFADEVADVAMGYVIALARQLMTIDRAVRRGEWLQPPGWTLRGRTLGIVGLGSIGRALATRARAFGMELIGADPQAPPRPFLEQSGLTLLELDELVERSDAVVLCCNATPQNRHLIDARRLERMREGALLVNVARGVLVDQAALIAAVRSGHLGGVALDVFESEPLPEDSGLRSFERCLFGSHNGSNTEDAVHRVNELVLRQLVESLGVSS